MRTSRSLAFHFLVWILSGAFVGFLLLIVFDVVSRGGGRLDFPFLTGPVERSGREGGILPVLVSTTLITGLSIVATLLLGLPTALALTHNRVRHTWYAKAGRTSLEVLATVPSVVFGLFGHLLFVKKLGLGYSILAGALTLSLMCLPFFIRLLEDAFRRTPLDQWSATEALGLSYKTFALKILLPSQKPLMITALTLSIARALSETAALIFTSGYSARMPESLLDSGRTLSVHIMDLALNVTGGDLNAFRSAFLLILVTFIFQILARSFLLLSPRTNP